MGLKERKMILLKEEIDHDRVGKMLTAGFLAGL